VSKEIIVYGPHVNTSERLRYITTLFIFNNLCKNFFIVGIQITLFFAKESTNLFVSIDKGIVCCTIDRRKKLIVSNVY